MFQSENIDYSGPKYYSMFLLCVIKVVPLTRIRLETIVINVLLCF